MINVNSEDKTDAGESSIDVNLDAKKNSKTLLYFVILTETLTIKYFT